MIRSLVEPFAIPGTLEFLLLGLVLGIVLLLRTRWRWLGQTWLVLLVAGYWGMSTEALVEPVARWMAGPYTSLRRASEAGGATAIVVLTGGMDYYRVGGFEVDALTAPSSLRTVEAARVYRLLGQPLVVVTGISPQRWANSPAEADVIRDHLVALGVSPDRLIVEKRSTSTREHALNVPPILRAQGVVRFVLVTSLPHMRRSMRAFLAESTAPVASPAEMFPALRPGVGRWRRYLPSPEALEVSAQVMHEWAGLAYYWLLGWA